MTSGCPNRDRPSRRRSPLDSPSPNERSGTTHLSYGCTATWSRHQPGTDSSSSSVRWEVCTRSATGHAEHAHHEERCIAEGEVLAHLGRGADFIALRKAAGGGHRVHAVYPRDEKLGKPGRQVLQFVLVI